MNAMTGGSGGQAGQAGMQSGGQGGVSGTSAGQGGASGVNAGQGGQGGAMVVSGGAGGSVPPTCTDRAIHTQPSVRDLMLLIDGGTSMASTLSGEPGVTRWNAVRQAIGDAAATPASPDTRLGLAVYSTGDMCPLPFVYDLPLEEMGMTSLPSEPPGVFAPTADVIGAMASELAASFTTLVIVTASDPTTCAAVDGAEEHWPSAIAAAEAAVDMGFRVVLVPIDVELSREEAQRFANAGSGVSADAAPGVELPMITTQATLSAALASALQSEVPCEVRIDAVVREDRVCEGEIALDGNPLACDDDDGFSLVHPNRITLHGSACEAFEAGSPLTVAYPCEALIEPLGGP